MSETGYDPSRHRRRSIRLSGYDYSQAGAYFVTVVTRDRAMAFGDIADDQVRLNDAGQMVQAVWADIPQRYDGVDIDEFIVMPNHIHGIVVLSRASVVGAGPRARPGLSLPEVMKRFKTMTTTVYIDGVKNCGWQRFRDRLWQRNYFDRIVRDDEELNRIREYITQNPLRWHEDEENPDRSEMT